MKWALQDPVLQNRLQLQDEAEQRCDFQEYGVTALLFLVVNPEDLEEGCWLHFLEELVVLEELGLTWQILQQELP